MLLSISTRTSPTHHPLFQWAPTLGGECYPLPKQADKLYTLLTFQWAPTLGGECYTCSMFAQSVVWKSTCFNGHPPLGVNATRAPSGTDCACFEEAFQRAPTLGGECYTSRNTDAFVTNSVRRFKGHPPLGVNATPSDYEKSCGRRDYVSKGTHPWG